MVEVCNTVEISASPQRVWNALVNFDEYARWNPFVAIRRTAVSEEIEWSLENTLLKRRIWTKAIITEQRPLKVLSWSFGKRPIVFCKERFALEMSGGKTKLTHTFQSEGLIASLGRTSLERNMLKIVSQADEGLRRFLEARPQFAKQLARLTTTQVGGRRSGPAKPRRRK